MTGHRLARRHRDTRHLVIECVERKQRAATRCRRKEACDKAVGIAGRDDLLDV